MNKGNVNSTIKLLSNNLENGILSLNDTTFNLLKQKHPCESEADKFFIWRYTTIHKYDKVWMHRCWRHCFIRAPAHITDELIKLDGIAYRDNELRVEDATSTRKRTRNNISSKARRLSVVVNNLLAHLMNFYTMWNQHYKTKTSTMPYCICVLMTY